MLHIGRHTRPSAQASSQSLSVAACLISCKNSCQTQDWHCPCTACAATISNATQSTVQFIWKQHGCMSLCKQTSDLHATVADVPVSFYACCAYHFHHLFPERTTELLSAGPHYWFSNCVCLLALLHDCAMRVCVFKYVLSTRFRLALLRALLVYWRLVVLLVPCPQGSCITT